MLEFDEDDYAELGLARVDAFEIAKVLDERISRSADKRKGFYTRSRNGIGTQKLNVPRAPVACAHCGVQVISMHKTPKKFCGAYCAKRSWQVKHYVRRSPSALRLARKAARVLVRP